MENRENLPCANCKQPMLNKGNLPQKVSRFPKNFYTLQHLGFWGGHPSTNAFEYFCKCVSLRCFLAVLCIIYLANVSEAKNQL